LLPYSSCPAKDNFLFSFITTYLTVVKGLCIRDFTTYDFINLDQQAYLDWSLSKFETELLDIYFRFIRVKWIQSPEKLSTLVKSPCGLYVSVTTLFFVNVTGGAEWTVDKSIAEDLLNHNGMLPSLSKWEGAGTTRPKRISGLSVNSLRSCRVARESVYEKCLLQQWIDVDVMEKCPGGRGRGILATRCFLQNEIIVDYHARLISKDEMTDIADDDRSSYLFCDYPNGLFWDGSCEFCFCHPQSRLLGRLANYAEKSSRECNAKPQLFEFKPAKSPVFRTIILVATRDIAPLEELRFDYGDKACLELFK